MSHLTFLPALVALWIPLQEEHPHLQADPLSLAHQEWEQETGSNWRLIPEKSTGAARFLYGSSINAEFQPIADSDWFELGREALNSTFEMFQIADRTLVEDSVNFIPMAHIGGQDKYSVQFQQQQNGVRVVGGWCSVLFNASGDLLAVDSTGIPGLDRLDTQPLLNRFEAITVAHPHFSGETQQKANRISQPTLVVFPQLVGKVKTPRLAWEMELWAEGFSTIPSGRRTYIAADTPLGEVLQSDDLIHHQDLSGNAQAWASPGTLPDISSNPEVLMPMASMTVSSSAGSTTTDADGNFSIPYSGTSPVDLTFRFRGTWGRVMDSSGAEYALTQSYQPGVQADAILNPNKTSADTAEANAYRCIIDFHDWVKEQNPSDTRMDFSVLANVNLSSTCNAYYDGSSINFYSSGGGCNNTAYSTVAAHEEGHWANDRYNSGNGSDGFGEGNADVYGMYVYDTAVVGEYFTTSGGYVRTGNNTRQYCGDGNGGCYGQVHADGEVLMGAMWKVRSRLNATLGNTAGDSVANVLHSAWMNGYNDGNIDSIIEEHWLALDDTDGNIFNGTPNYNDIDGGFRDQGFPGVDLLLIDIVHTPLGNTQNETGPYIVEADISSWTGATITAAEVIYSVNGGVSNSVPMTNTVANTWKAGIPGQASPANVSYHIEAHDSAGNSVNDPKSGDHTFIVGVVTQLYFNDFDGSTDEGWTHATTGNSSNGQDDWQRGSPTGKSGSSSGVSWQDPNVAASGANCWGNDLGPSGWNGAYQANVDNYLESPIIDCSGEYGVKLRFDRWASFEKGTFDQAKILVNGQVAWENNPNTHLQDTSWTPQEVDISSWADNNPAVTVRFSLTTDQGVEVGGWQIDNFEVLTIGAVGGGDTIQLSGPTMLIPGSTASYSMGSGPSSGLYWAAWSTSLSGSVIQGHVFDLGLPINIITQGTFDATGSGSFTTPTIPPSASGLTVHLEIAGSDGTQFFDSNALTVTIL